MADAKISRLDPILSVESTDLFVIARNGRNYKVQPSAISNSVRGQTIVGGSIKNVARNAVTTGVTLPVDKSIITIGVVGLSETAKSLPDGVDGQYLTILVTNELEAQTTITPQHSNGFTSISLVDSGASVTLYFCNNAWFVLSSFKATIL